MFGLIISIVAIALAIAVTAMTLSSSGDTTNQGRVEAQAAQILNQSAQLKLAMERHTLEKPEVPLVSLSQLVDEKLITSLPAGWAAADNLNLYTHITVQVTGPTDAAKLAACNKANATLGIATVPVCSTVTAQFMGCCTD